MSSLKDTFLLDPQVVFLNHGSFGACPRPVFEVYQAWQYELERQPVEFLGRRATTLMAEARTELAAYLGTEASRIVYFPNPTTAINMVARNLDLKPGDEILTSDHEYGAMERTWLFRCRQSKTRYVRKPIPLPVTTHEDFAEHFWAGVTSRTRLIFLSHITSPTALIFPVKEMCRRAREAGILTIIDGAHAPGQLPLDLEDLGADFYTGACHKWMMSPKGAAFLYARPEVQSWLEPLVVSWGYDADIGQPPDWSRSSQFINYHEWQGTRDLAAFLSVPAAIEFQLRNNWDQIRQACHSLASQARQRMNLLTAMEPICPDSPDWFGQMCAVRLPGDTDLDQLKASLYEDYRVELPAFQWNGQKFLRLSFQGYNSQEDVDLLLEALTQLLPLSLVRD